MMDVDLCKMFSILFCILFNFICLGIGINFVRTDFKMIETPNIMRCRKLCKYTQDCEEIRYDVKTRSCFLLHTETMLAQNNDVPSIISETTQDIEIKEENQCSAQPCKEGTMCALSKTTAKGFHCIPLKGKWDYVFGAKSGTSKKVYETWLDDNYKCTDPQCDIYKNEFVGTWNNHKILKILVVLYTQLETVAWLEFNGTSSDSLDWFTADRLTDSSWKDIVNQSHNEFRIFKSGIAICRRFYISHVWEGCPDDKLWLVVSENAASYPCPWDMPGSFPQFRYSIHDTMTGPAELGYAEWFKVFIQEQ